MQPCVTQLQAPSDDEGLKDEDEDEEEKKDEEGKDKTAVF